MSDGSKVHSSIIYPGWINGIDDNRKQPIIIITKAREVYKTKLTLLSQETIWFWTLSLRTTLPIFSDGFTKTIMLLFELHLRKLFAKPQCLRRACMAGQQQWKSRNWNYRKRKRLELKGGVGGVLLTMLDPRNGSHQREISVSNLATIDFVRLCACGGKFGARAQRLACLGATTARPG